MASPKPDSDVHIVTQIAGGVVAAESAARASEEVAGLARQDAALRAALGEVQKVREFVGTPEHILGNPNTKHGEIAEQVEVGIRRARQVLEYLEPTAWKDGLLRNGPTDYVIDGIDVQSKFVNGVAKNLDHVLEHMRKYPNFGRDGSYYHIPRDHFEVIEKALRGEGHGDLSARTLSRIAARAREIQELSGQDSFDRVVRAGISDYADVQQGRVHSTLDGHDRELTQRDERIRSNIHDEHGPSLEGAGSAAATGALIGAGVRLTSAIWTKHKAGKKMLAGDYGAEDWRELGLQAAVGGAQGGIAAAAIYGLTNYAEFAAPFAGAVVSSAMAVADLTRRYHAGEISLDEYCELGQVACLEGAVVGLTAAVGQTLIPVPVLGAAVGAIAGRMLVSFSKALLDQDSKALAARLRVEHDHRVAHLDRAYREFLDGLLRRYDLLGMLTARAFDVNANIELRFAASVDLARSYGVREGTILKTVGDVDRFILS